MLFTVAHSSQQCDLPALTRLIAESDALLLMQDGVTSILRGSRALAVLDTVACPVYVLIEDLHARGLVGQISDKVTPIDYTGFVELTEKHCQQIAW